MKEKQLPSTITPREAKRLAEQGMALIIDVRDQEEWDADHVPGARHIPLDEISTRVHEVPRHDNVVVMCRSGRRSGVACEYLRCSGFARVANLDGGILAWKEAGLPTSRG